MDFFSTRGEGPVSGARAIINGIAKDGGLYVPSSFPAITRQDLEDLTVLDYAERAAYIMSLYLTEFTYEELLQYTTKAYDRFDGDAAPLVKVDEGTFLLELWHGPTLAFKDIALTMLPHLLTASKKKEGDRKKTLILVATSGDTGKAALEGFRDVEDTEIIVLFPASGVSTMQKLQMQTTKGSNVHVLGIEGNFDDAQTAVKNIFADKKMGEALSKKGFSLSSANSINFGRLLPQIVYYISAYVDLLGGGEVGDGGQVDFIVPCGNFGNILAGYYAKEMGIPIRHLVVASNKNNVLTEFFTDGFYNSNREFYKTMSPSMDILISSNLERLLYEIGGRDPQFVKKLMGELSASGFYHIDEDTLYDKLYPFFAYSATEAETAEIIDNFFDEYGYLLDPHTAVAMDAFVKYTSEAGDVATPAVIVSTANPYKFPEAVYQAVSHSTEDDADKAVKKLEFFSGMEIPPQIAELKNLPVLHDQIVTKEQIAEKILELIG